MNAYLFNIAQDVCSKRHLRNQRVHDPQVVLRQLARALLLACVVAGVVLGVWQ